MDNIYFPKRGGKRRRLSLLLWADAEFPKLAPEGGLAQTELTGRGCTAAVVAAQRLEDHSAFDVGELCARRGMDD